MISILFFFLLCRFPATMGTVFTLQPPSNTTLLLENLHFREEPIEVLINNTAASSNSVNDAFFLITVSNCSSQKGINISSASTVTSHIVIKNNVVVNGNQQLPFLSVQGLTMSSNSTFVIAGNTVTTTLSTSGSDWDKISSVVHFHDTVFLPAASLIIDSNNFTTTAPGKTFVTTFSFFHSQLSNVEWKDNNIDTKGGQFVFSIYYFSTKTQNGSMVVYRNNSIQTATTSGGAYSILYHTSKQNHMTAMVYSYNTISSTAAGLGAYSIYYYSTSSIADVMSVMYSANTITTMALYSAISIYHEYASSLNNIGAVVYSNNTITSIAPGQAYSISYSETSILNHIKALVYSNNTIVTTPGTGGGSYSISYLYSSSLNNITLLLYSNNVMFSLGGSYVNNVLYYSGVSLKNLILVGLFIVVGVAFRSKSSRCVHFCSTAFL